MIAKMYLLLMLANTSLFLTVSIGEQGKAAS